MINGKIIIVDLDDRVVEELAIRDGRVLAVWANEEIKPLIGPWTAVIDLGSSAVTPGFVDSHNHTVEYGFSELVLDVRYPTVDATTTPAS